MKQIPNILSISRMVLSLSLILFINNLTLLIAVYIVCGLTDVFDGAIARATGTESILGARIDSAADLLLYVMIMVIMIIELGNKLIILLPLLIAVVFIRGMNLIIAALKYRSFSSVHTWFNKVTGVLVFLTPILFFITRSVALLLFVCAVAVLSALEESAILILSKKLDLNRKSIFHNGKKQR